MTDDVIMLPYVFPFFFAGVWFFISTILGFMSGWFGLQQSYPDDGSAAPYPMVKKNG